MFDAPNSDLSILIVDDEEGVRSILSDYFSNLGYQVSAAGIRFAHSAKRVQPTSE